MYVVGKLKVSQHDGASAHRAVRTDDCTSGNAGTSGHGAVLADSNVVTNLHQVVELDAVLENRVLQRAAINAGIGADLDIIADHNRAELLDLDPPAIVWRKTKPVRTNDCT